jgi:hypothetical protein
MMQASSTENVMPHVIDHTAESKFVLGKDVAETDKQHCQKMAEAEKSIKRPGDTSVRNGAGTIGTTKWGFSSFLNILQEEVHTEQTTILEARKEWLQDARRTTGDSDVESVISEDSAMGTHSDAE